MGELSDRYNVSRTTKYKGILQSGILCWKAWLSRYTKKSKVCDIQACQSMIDFFEPGVKKDEVTSLMILSRRLSSWLSSILGARCSGQLVQSLSPFLQPTYSYAPAKAGQVVHTRKATGENRSRRNCRSVPREQSVR